MLALSAQVFLVVVRSVLEPVACSVSITWTGLLVCLFGSGLIVVVWSALVQAVLFNLVWSVLLGLFWFGTLT